MSPWGGSRTTTTYGYGYAPAAPHEEHVIHQPLPQYGWHQHDETVNQSPYGTTQSSTYHYAPVHPADQHYYYWPY